MYNALVVRRISLSVVMSHLLQSTVTILMTLESSVEVSVYNFYKSLIFCNGICFSIQPLVFSIQLLALKVVFV